MSALINNNSNTNDVNQVQGGVEAQCVVEEHNDDLTLYRTGHLDGTQPEINDDTVVATQLDGIVVAAGEDRGAPSGTSGTPQGSGRRLNEHQSSISYARRDPPGLQAVLRIQWEAGSGLWQPEGGQ